MSDEIMYGVFDAIDDADHVIGFTAGTMKCYFGIEINTDNIIIEAYIIHADKPEELLIVKHVEITTSKTTGTRNALYWMRDYAKDVSQGFCTPCQPERKRMRMHGEFCAGCVFKKAIV